MQNAKPAARFYSLEMASSIARAARRALLPLFAWVLMALTPSAALAACETALDFSGASVGATRTLDVSTCHIDIRWGLYKNNATNARSYYPVSGTSLVVPDSDTITVSNGATLRFAPLDIVSFIGGALTVSTDVVNSYTVTLLSTGTGASGTATLYYADGVVENYSRGPVANIIPTQLTRSA